MVLRVEAKSLCKNIPESSGLETRATRGLKEAHLFFFFQENGARLVFLTEINRIVTRELVKTTMCTPN